VSFPPVPEVATAPLVSHETGGAAPRPAIRPFAFYGLALLVVAIDQAVKAWVRGALDLGQTMVLWPGVFQLMYTQNRGMAFSLLEGQRWILIAAAVLVTLAIVVAERRTRGTLPVWTGVALALPLGGAVGNLIDRAWHGFVTDLFHFSLINFPVFNVADAAITVGIALLAYRTLIEGDKQPEPATPIVSPTPNTTTDTQAG
jgi:signal peptidase II